MKLLIAPRSPVPTRIKGLIRWLIVQYVTKVRDQRFELYEYGEGCDVPGWDGWFEHNGMCIYFKDTEGDLHYNW